jgi:hypothetical protein
VGASATSLLILEVAVLSLETLLCCKKVIIWTSVVMKDTLTSKVVVIQPRCVVMTGTLTSAAWKDIIFSISLLNRQTFVALVHARPFVSKVAVWVHSSSRLVSPGQDSSCLQVLCHSGLQQLQWG